MTKTIFLSWQSDLGETRNIIRDALDKVVKNLNRDVTLEEALRVDEDTAGVAGWPEITQTILEKIEGCEVFIADITPINGPQSSFRLTPNPNVLFELGYALATGLGRARIICVVNASYLPGGDLKELPFDVRGSRPLQFSLEGPGETRRCEGPRGPGPNHRQGGPGKKTRKCLKLDIRRHSSRERKHHPQRHSPSSN